jgi:hypothetical protein
LCLSQPKIARDAYDGDFSTFTNHCTSDFKNDIAPDEPGHLRDAGWQRMDHDAWSFVLDKKRWPLSNHPAVLYGSELFWKDLHWLFFQSKFLKLSEPKDCPCPLCVMQVVRSAEEKEISQAKAEAKKTT